ncbi:MAG: hypothetical protein IH899_02065 [Planctomycetes bacterium]|nr:hypothetical protein [Planctomycetota bacterium]
MLAEQVVALEGGQNSFTCRPGTQVFKLPLSDKLVLTMDGRFPNLRCSFSNSVTEAVPRARLFAMTLKGNGGM